MPQQLRRRRTTLGLVLLTIVWSVAVVAGLTMTWRYKSTPGKAAEAPITWPASSTVQRAGEQSTLVMVAHPRCPCTRASIAELARVLAGTHGAAGKPPRAHVLFVRPEGTPAGWEQGDLWQAASRIPGVTVHADVDGTEAARFGATVSGTTLVYDARGHLLFQGGITESRGHEGDNAGERSVVAALRGASAEATSPIFGCDVR